MADAHKTLGQNMQAQATDKLLGCQGYQVFLSAFSVVFSGETYRIKIDRAQSMITDGHLMGVAPHVFNDLFGPGKGLFAIHHPGRLNQAFGQRWRQVHMVA